jgi:mono/diheme cytochrome c family protein
MEGGGRSQVSVRRALTIVGALCGLAVLGAALGLAAILRHGISARDEPTTAEACVARAIRHLAIPREARAAKNPVPLAPEVLARARVHFADHCATCHGNDGRGETTIGRNLYPKAPDMTKSETQELSDGEILSIIENGVRLTGMPAWGAAESHDLTESWELVHFIRHLPKITPEELREMESENPKSAAEREEEEQIRDFLAGKDEASRKDPQQHRH